MAGRAQRQLITDNARADFSHGAIYSPEAEEAVLGCILINQEAYSEVASFLLPEDFHLHKHRWIWDAVTRLHQDQKPADLLTVSDELQRRDQFEEAGGTAFLTHLINVVPTSLRVEAYGRVVQRDGIRRRLLEAASAVAKLAYEEERPITDILSDAQAVIVAASGANAQVHQMSADVAVSEFHDQLEARLKDPEAFALVPSMLTDLNRLMDGGARKGDLHLIAGRPGTGKTTLLLNWARFVADLKLRVVFFLLEMPTIQLITRLLSGESQIGMSSLRKAELRDDEWPTLIEAMDALALPNLIFDDTPSLSPEQMIAKCERLNMEAPLDLIIVDYLQLMSAGRRFENKNAEVSHLSRNLKLLARRLNAPVLAGSQLSRDIERRGDKKPVLADLRDSGSLEQDSDVVLMLFNNGGEEFKGANGQVESKVIEILVEKQRNGPTGSVLAVFLKKTNRLVNAQPPEVSL